LSDGELGADDGGRKTRKPNPGGGATFALGSGHRAAEAEFRHFGQDAEAKAKGQAQKDRRLAWQNV